ncbi:MAG: N-acetylglucosamine-6-phosphate deacetylase, partial [Pseudomonadota bacterium]|nr:N-acetylglucosamine-6-phosphate deacetylase [Pseudomonadota bacterium]
MKLCVERVITPAGILNNAAITIEQGVITHIDEAGDSPVTPGTLLPGYVDTQVNGGGGVLFNQHLDYESLDVLARAHLQVGTTSLLPTLITDCE